MVNKYLQTVLKKGIGTATNIANFREQVLFQLLSLGVTVSLLASTSACGMPRNEVSSTRQINQGTTMTIANDMPAPPGGVPVNRRFEKLDDYLNWLRDTQAPIDKPYYEEIRPGVYQLRTGNLRVLVPESDEAASEQTVTRAELLKKFGFSN
ncbi:MAG: hypothetical protein V4696_04835 [Pseudomonadota bacterium]